MLPLLIPWILSTIVLGGLSGAAAAVILHRVRPCEDSQRPLPPLVLRDATTVAAYAWYAHDVRRDGLADKDQIIQRLQALVDSEDPDDGAVRSGR